MLWCFIYRDEFARMGEDLVPGGADKGEGEKDEEMTDGGYGECPGESGGS